MQTQFPKLCAHRSETLCCGAERCRVSREKPQDSWMTLRPHQDHLHCWTSSSLSSRTGFVTAVAIWGFNEPMMASVMPSNSRADPPRDPWLVKPQHEEVASWKQGNMERTEFKTSDKTWSRTGAAYGSESGSTTVSLSVWQKDQYGVLLMLCPAVLGAAVVLTQQQPRPLMHRALVVVKSSL
ncbi:unnamed protein product [Pleuronectes platessa]|uniref:Uncharacterized protein n=1 Tax=Pleuronectes platessa TaxID=8262 RepID=A0A9N7UC39_PLEPL|nr:unnamed protein product [Pleuronectes platessa]